MWQSRHDLHGLDCGCLSSLVSCWLPYPPRYWLPSPPKNIEVFTVSPISYCYAPPSRPFTLFLLLGRSSFLPFQDSSIAFCLTQLCELPSVHSTSPSCLSAPQVPHCLPYHSEVPYLHTTHPQLTRREVFLGKCLGDVCDSLWWSLTCKQEQNLGKLSVINQVLIKSC